MSGARGGCSIPCPRQGRPVSSHLDTCPASAVVGLAAVIVCTSRSVCPLAQTQTD